ncbi:PQQ-dependent sugar dehydrogenase [Liquorilactobacillus capillatus]|uniref:Glucose/Sorbosone dehydrogenase domain-containing protein n=1 Tax=Liquorilactobacillus capillatus DSM 19910 TaxID=1423731 RepID=A0A0R1MFN6_9LACO|nr:PQQ-dependent sugar dehydrogenase [Liquorilactobacillus capillatus]KRL02440.1 hypothetical protein FC81_GL000784 [Liquorilactobacillus capillatus DSM 19910]
MKKAYIIVGIIGVIFVVGAGMLVYSKTSLNQPQQGNVSGLAKKTTLGSKPKVRASNLEAPWSLIFYKKSALVSLRDSGEIREVLANKKTRVIGTVAGVEHGGEAGLLGMAVSDRSKQPYLYVYYSTDKDNRIVRYKLHGRSGHLSLGQRTLLLSGIPHAANHNGGRLAFGPDGMLYATTGDAGNPANAQKRTSLGGKILRMTAAGKVPSDNPFKGSLVYSYGHRNPQGLAWSKDGTMYATEFGQDRWDELNKIEAGHNYGWPTYEGKTRKKGFTNPVQQWKTLEASPSGMVFEKGVLFIANLRGTSIRAVAVSNLASSVNYFRGRYGRIRDVTVSPKGELWFITNNTDGRGSPKSNDDRVLSVPLIQQK